MENSHTVILVVEDDSGARHAITAALQEAGFETLEAADGQAGLTLALAQQPDLVLSDNLMPGKTGTEMLNAIRTDTWGAQVPFIMLTSQYDLAAMNNALTAGNTDYLSKDEVSLGDIVMAVTRRLL